MTTPENRISDDVIRDRLNRAMRRRMSDDLVSLIRRACLIGHIDTAKALWLVLVDLTARETKQHFPHGRRPDESLIEQLAMEIDAARRNKGPVSAEAAPAEPMPIDAMSAD